MKENIDSVWKIQFKEDFRVIMDWNLDIYQDNLTWKMMK